MQNPLGHAVGIQVGRGKKVLIRSERHDAGEPRAVQGKGARRQAGGVVRTQVVIKECLNTCVYGTQPAGEKFVFLEVVTQQRTGDFVEIGVGAAAAGGLAQRGELQVDITDQFLMFFLRFQGCLPDKTSSSAWIRSERGKGAQSDAPMRSR